MALAGTARHASRTRAIQPLIGDRRLEAAGADTVALAAHPGGSDTELGRHMPGGRLLEPLTRLMAQTAAMGALPTLRAATDRDARGGQYYGPDDFMETRGHPVLVESSDRFTTASSSNDS